VPLVGWKGLGWAGLWWGQWSSLPSFLSLPLHVDAAQSGSSR
jgi:hypothetical protein